jgi:hypothetical protein
MDPGLGFWLRYLESEGGLWERAASGVLVMLPPGLGDGLGVPEEMTVTCDPDVAREDGATLLGPGHPLLTRAAENVLREGDAQVIVPPAPSSAPPDTSLLLEKARDQFPVDHGKIDVAGEVAPARHQVLRVGVLVDYAISADERFQELAECWIDVPSRRELPGPVASRLARAAGSAAEQQALVGARVIADESLTAALAEAHRRIDAQALCRRAALASQVAPELAAERDRARAYYDEALKSIVRRRRAATPDRAALLDARADSTRAERQRRLAEIEEKYQARHQIRPFRLHLLMVPALRLPVHVRRGDRRYPLTLDWLLPVGAFSDLRCPHCDHAAPLVAAKSRLGCESCLAPAAPVAAPLRPSAVAPSPRVPAPPSGASAPPSRPSAPPSGATAMPGGWPPGATSRTAERRPTERRPTAAGPRPAPRAEPTRSAAQLRRIGDKMARNFWQAAATGDEERLRRLCASGSPAAVAVTLFGPSGPGRAIGLGPTDQPLALSAGTVDSAPGDMEVTAGEVETATLRNSYQLRWRLDGGKALVEEILPFGYAVSGRMPSARWLFTPAAPRLFAELPAPRVRLDPVARLLWRIALPRHGLPVVLRCLAAWLRLAEPDVLAGPRSAHPGRPAPARSGQMTADELIADRSPADLAAAVERMIAMRATGHGSYAETAGAYRADEAAVRKLSADLQKRLKLSSSQQW